jgi:AcrR family transcriptional regulator
VERPVTIVKSERSFYFEEVPRVSDHHLAARRRQILDAARACFMRKGFHASSIQDVIAEAGLSVGAVYRYFPSKTHLIRAIVEQVVSEVEEALGKAAVDESVPLESAMAQAVELLEPNLGPDGIMRLAVQVWAEALRDETLAEVVAEVYSRLRAIFVLLARRAQATGELPAEAEPEQVGAALFALLIGYGMQKLLTGGPALEDYQAGLRALLP